MAELRECPFCGGEAYTYTCKTIRKGKEMRAWIVHCRECQLNYPAKDICYTESEAVVAWNRRYTPPSEIDFDYGAED